MTELNFAGYENRIPQHTQASLRRYIEQGCYPGGFVTAVLCNDLMRAINSADSDNLAALPAIAQFVYNRMPETSWGSAEKIRSTVTAFWEAKKVDADTI